jgi:PAS domain S-box-containing protein
VNKSTVRAGLLFLVLAGGFLLLDLSVDRIVGETAGLNLPHFVFAAVVVLTSFILLRLATERHSRAEAALRQARDEMESRVAERTEELKRANAALQGEIAGRERHEAQIEHLSSFPQLNPNPVIEVDALGAVVFRNSAAMKVLRDLGLEEDPRTFLPHDLPSILQDLNRKGRERYQREVRVGTAVFEEVLHLVPVFGSVRIYASNITERKRIESELRASEEKYRLLFENMAEGFALYELLYDSQGRPSDWRVMEANDAYTHHTGISREHVVGRRISELFPEAIPEYLPRFAAVVATQTPSGFETYAKAISRYQHVVTFPAGDHRFASTIEDVTDRKQAEEALRASEEKFATVFRFSPVGLVIARAGDGTFLDVNEAFAAALGYERSDMLGRSGRDVSLVPSIDAQNRLIEVFRERGQVVDHELDVKTKDGGIATILVSLAPIKVGGEGCVLAVAHDITNRKRFQETLHRAQSELALVSQEQARMEERQRLARELHDSVSQALYGISLGINTAQTLFDTDREKVREALSYSLSLAKDGLTEMRALIFALRPESLSMEGLVAALTKEVAAFRARCEFVVEFSPCDEPRLELPAKEALYRIAQEALQNALKHARCSRLDVRLTCTREGVRLDVRDNGVGFDPAALHPGHLGLRSMRERAMNAGGKLEIISAPGCGTLVRADIPLQAAPRA